MDPFSKPALEAIYTQCDICEQMGFSISGSDKSLREYTRFSVMKFLVYLAGYDHRVWEQETQFLNSLLDYCMTSDQIERFTAANAVTAESIFDTTLSLLVCFIKADVETDPIGGSSLALIQFYNTLGTEFLSLDAAKDSRAQKQLELLVLRLRNYRATYISNWQMLLAKKRLKRKDRPAVPKSPFAPVTGGISNAAPEPAPPAEQPKETEETLEDYMAELNSLTGLSNVKQDLNSLINLIKVRKLREERGMPQPPVSLHMVFSGNPGTGKTTVARLLANIYRCLGVLPKGHLVEVDRSGLVSGYVGQTALKTKEVIDRAIGGVLFIDEAYALTANTGNGDFGMEAVNTLLKAMEDHRDDLIVIAAGYSDLMEEFLNSNPGLRSRFNKIITFQDYLPDELTEIFESICHKSQFAVEPDAKQFVFDYFSQRCAQPSATFANARDIRNFFERAMTNQANRLASLEDLTDETLITITLEDVQDITL